VSANLDLVRSIYAAWERGDFSSAEWAVPEIEFVIADGLSPESWKGLAGMAEGFRSYIEVWDNVRIEVDQVHELDDGRIVVVFRRTGRGKASGITELPGRGAEGAVVFLLDNAKVSRLVLYFDRTNALADLGLAPDAGI
jgi:ketosteroid isomerase-like protein